MIRYSLTCDNGHRFESWFQSAAAYDTLSGKALVSCAFCGSTVVDKALMAPMVRTDQPATTGALTTTPAPTALERKLTEMRKKIEETSDYVGLSFAAEARAMHDGDIPERSIYGEARADEARALIEDGIPVVPLPFLPKRQAN